MNNVCVKLDHRKGWVLKDFKITKRHLREEVTPAIPLPEGEDEVGGWVSEAYAGLVVKSHINEDVEWNDEKIADVGFKFMELEDLDIQPEVRKKAEDRHIIVDHDSIMDSKLKASMIDNQIPVDGKFKSSESGLDRERREGRKEVSVEVRGGQPSLLRRESGNLNEMRARGVSIAGSIATEREESVYEEGVEQEEDVGGGDVGKKDEA